MLNIVTGKRYGTVPDEVIQYAAGYYGATVAPIDQSVLARLARVIRLRHSRLAWTMAKGMVSILCDGFEEFPGDRAAVVGHGARIPIPGQHDIEVPRIREGVV